MRSYSNWTSDLMIMCALEYCALGLSWGLLYRHWFSKPCCFNKVVYIITINQHYRKLIVSSFGNSLNINNVESWRQNKSSLNFFSKSYKFLIHFAKCLPLKKNSECVPMDWVFSINSHVCKSNSLPLPPTNWIPSLPPSLPVIHPNLPPLSHTSQYPSAPPPESSIVIWPLTSKFVTSIVTEVWPVMERIYSTYLNARVTYSEKIKLMKKEKKKIWELKEGKEIKGDQCDCSKENQPSWQMCKYCLIKVSEISCLQYCYQNDEKDIGSQGPLGYSLVRAIEILM